jgi:hypothetical protein
METTWSCKECGTIQEPVKREGHWEFFSPRCTSCGGRLSIKLKERQPLPSPPAPKREAVHDL